MKKKTKSNKTDWLSQALVGNYSIFGVSVRENHKEKEKRSQQSKPESFN